MNIGPLIFIPSGKFIEPNDQIICRAGMSGHFTLSIAKVGPDGQPIEATRRVVASFDNIITNAGLDRVGQAGDWLSACQVGTGNATPQATDTGLQVFLAGVASVHASVGGAQGSAPFFGWRRTTFRFGPGVGTGNLSEVGVGWASTGSTLFSRALILDAGLMPTTITKLADESLDVTYELRNHPAAADSTGNLTITGVGTMTFTTRAASVTTASDWDYGSGSSNRRGGVSATGNLVHSGTIGAVTGEPSGTFANPASVANAAYSNGSFQRTATITFGLTEGNVGGIRSLAVRYGSTDRGFGRTQTEFGTIIPKTSAQTMVFNVVHNWGRQ